MASNRIKAIRSIEVVKDRLEAWRDTARGIHAQNGSDDQNNLAENYQSLIHLLNAAIIDLGGSPKP